MSAVGLLSCGLAVLQSCSLAILKSRIQRTTDLKTKAKLKTKRSARQRSVKTFFCLLPVACCLSPVACSLPPVFKKPYNLNYIESQLTPANASDLPG
jgi:hypothetical protein